MLSAGFGGAYIIPEGDETRSDGTTLKYYSFAGQMVATLAPGASAGVRDRAGLQYLLTDHLGSVVAITDDTGTLTSQQRYYPYGETRLTTGSMFTDKLFTGQRELAGLGIYNYNARFYSPKLGRFISADTIVPDYSNPQAYNRYSYVLNSPLRYTDPTGHRNCEEDGYNCPGNDKLSIILGRIQYAVKKATKNWEVPSSMNPPSNIVTCIWGPTCVRELMGRAMVHEKDSVLSGRGLEVLQNDRRLLNLQDEIVDSVKSDPRYEVEDFTQHRKQEPVTFGAEGLLDAFRSQTFSVRAVNIDADIHAIKSGEIYINYEFTDVLDLRPDWTNEARTKSGYNFWTAYFFGPIWHDFLGASDEMEVYAHWMTVIK